MIDETPSRVTGNIFLKLVCIRKGSSSLMRNWLNWMPYSGWKVEIRYVSGAISVTLLFITSKASI
jgi:hypothetical protein